ncbi:phage tail sheath subtilisin-like domain-containing protein [Arsenophonus sp. PmNCSU2021_1]|uniref:phage tail sheath subtilisin-like domain-containing protein n=1 Tax=Arsenophonus sp. PmNCSU2021_1 TaxID=3118989 RepID=UPI002FEE6DC0
MTISFNEISAGVRLPLTHIEIDNSQAVTGNPTTLTQVLMLGQAAIKDGKVDGSGAVDTPVRITRADHAATLWGQGSMLAAMVREFLTDNPDAVLTVMAQGNGAGKADAGSLTLSGTAQQAGVLNVYLGGVRVRVTVEKGQQGKAVGDALALAINALPSLPVTAVSAAPGGENVTADQTVVTLTARFISDYSAQDIRLNYYDGEITPPGLAVTLAAPAARATNPDLANSIAALGDTQYHHIVMPWLDAANLKLLSEALRDRWGPTKMSDGIAWAAHTGSLGEITQFGKTRNDFLLTCSGIQRAPEPAYLWAATLCAIGAKHLSLDPARPLQSLRLPRRLVPALSDRLRPNERNQLLYDGIATVTVGADDGVQIERQITTYRTNAYGDPDPSYLDVNTVATLSYLRYSTRVRITQRFPRHKLADDGTPVAPGQAMVTPAIIRTQLLALAIEWLEAGLIENFERFRDSLIVERNNNDRNRVDVQCTPDIVNQFRIFAEQIQFIL